MIASSGMIHARRRIVKKNECSWSEWISLPEYTQRILVAGRRPGGKRYNILAEVERYKKLHPDAKIAILAIKKEEKEKI